MGLCVHHVCTEADIVPLPLDVPGGNQVHRKVVLPNGDVRVFTASCDKHVGDFAAGDVPGMEDAPGGMPALAPEVEFVALGGRQVGNHLLPQGEVAPKFLELADALRRGLHNRTDDVRLA